MSCGSDDIIGLSFGFQDDDYIQTHNNNIISVPDNGNNSDVINSVASAVLGSVSDRSVCPTCRNTKDKCTGHSGHIKLGTPVCSPLFIEQIVKYLNVICFECGGIIIPVDESMTFSKISTVITSRRAKNKNTCENIVDRKNGTPVLCGAVHPHVHENKKDARGLLIQEFYTIDPLTKKKKVEKVQNLFPHEIQRIFSRIMPETLKYLGISSPELAPSKLVNNYFYVPPNSIRPNAYSHNMSKVPKNDFNVQINSILKESQKLGDSSLQMEEKKNVTVIKEIQKNVYNLKRSTATGQEKVQNSYLSVMSGKTGYLRGSLLGCRVSGVGRQFITGNPYAKLDEVFIPMSMAMKLQFPIVVTAHNIAEMTRFVANSGDTYPRCTSIYRASEKANFLVSHMKNKPIKVGDTIYRDLIDGDAFAFCRQPTLQLSNISGAIARITKDGKSVTFNPNILTLFAGDYDGDEMNEYIPSDENSKFEIENKASINEMLISNGRGQPIVGQIMDGVLGLALLTRDNVKLSLPNACRMFDNSELTPDLKKYMVNGFVSGRSILTALFDVLKIKINYSGKAKYYAGGKLNAYRTYSETEVNVSIKDGVFVSGIIDGGAVGSKAYGGINHIIYHKYGAKTMSSVIWYMQRISINYLDMIGFTMNINDFRLRAEEDKKIREYELGIIARSRVHTHDLWKGNIVAPSNKSISEHYENEQIKILTETQTYNKFLHDGMDYDNNDLYMSVHSGSKGSPENVIDGVVSGGQVLLDGARLKPELAGRVSHFYPRFTDDPCARGFIVNSYTTGYTPNDVFCASFSHRRGIVSKALSTADSGAKNRDGSCSLDSNILNYFRQVVKGPKLRQLLYGGDGMDPRATYKTTTKLIHLSADDLKKISAGDEFKQLLADRDFCRDIFINQQHRTNEKVGDIGYIPVNFPLMFSDVQTITGPKDNGNHAVILKFIEGIPRFYLHKNYTGNVPEYMVFNTKLFQAYLRYELRSEVVNQWPRRRLEVLMHLIETDFINNLEDPGTVVGIRAVQATSEIHTQQSLSSIHAKAGETTSFKNIVNTVPTKKMTNASMEIFFKELQGPQIEDFAKQIEMLKAKYFVKQFQIFYEAHDDIRHPLYKHESKLIEEKSKLAPFPKDILNWCIRLEFDISRLVVKNMALEDIYIQLLKNHPYLHIVFGTLNSKTPVMRIYLKQAVLYNYSLKNTHSVIALTKTLLKTIVRGIDGIKTTYISTKEIATIVDDKPAVKRVNYIKTEGTNLARILLFPEVDPYLTTSNALFEYQELFGITVTYNMVLDNLRMGISGAYNSHYTVMISEMCSKHFITAINRNGSAKRDSSVCQLIADGAWLRVIKNAALNGKIDKNIGVNSAIIMGTAPKVGTNYVNVIYNENFVKQESSKNMKELEDL